MIGKPGTREVPRNILSALGVNAQFETLGADAGTDTRLAEIQPYPGRDTDATLESKPHAVDGTSPPEIALGAILVLCMAESLERRLRPEEHELARKREELAALKLTLAECELELATVRGELAAFEGLYLRRVGIYYAELDEWIAKVAELKSKLNPTPETKQQAADARAQARQTEESAHGDAATVSAFTPSAELKSLFRDVARRIHPDLCRDAQDLERRNRLMAEANRAYASGDAETLRRILDEYHDEAEPLTGIGGELVRIIRQISQANLRLSMIEQELLTLRASELAVLKMQVDEAKSQGTDLLEDLAESIRDKIERVQIEFQNIETRGHL